MKTSNKSSTIGNKKSLNFCVNFYLTRTLLQRRKVREQGNLFYETFLKTYFEPQKRDLKYLGKTGVFGASEPPPIEMIFLLILVK